MIFGTLISRNYVGYKDVNVRLGDQIQGQISDLVLTK